MKFTRDTNNTLKQLPELRLVPRHILESLGEKTLCFLLNTLDSQLSCIDKKARRNRTRDIKQPVPEILLKPVLGSLHFLAHVRVFYLFAHAAKPPFSVASH